jgi:hypothetical protein
MGRGARAMTQAMTQAMAAAARPLPLAAAAYLPLALRLPRIRGTLPSYEHCAHLPHSPERLLALVAFVFRVAMMFLPALARARAATE